MLPTIIGVSGKKQSGKDTLCQYLGKWLTESHRDFVILPIAFELKQIAKKFFGAIEEQVNGTDAQKETALPNGRTGRQMLQRIASGWRELDDMCFIRAWDRIRSGLAPTMHVLVPDVRFPNEMEYIHHLGGIVIRLTRDVCEKDPHESENAMAHALGFDLVVVNDALTIAATNEAVKQWLVSTYLNTEPFDPRQAKNLNTGTFGVDRRGEKGIGM